MAHPLMIAAAIALKSGVVAAAAPVVVPVLIGVGTVAVVATVIEELS